MFIDADHTYNFVKSDSENAFKLLSPGGIIIWDDYLWENQHPECKGVTNYLNNLQKLKKIYHINGTRFAIHIDYS